METPSLRDEYRRLRPLCISLKSEVVFMLRKSLKDSDLRIHSLSSRVKTLKSARAKLDRKGLPKLTAGQGGALARLDDMVGVRVVTLFRADLDPVTELVNGLFADCATDDKIADLETSATGYQSIHVTACLPDRFRGYRYDQIKGIRFEVQIRTIAMDAWATISHHLNYNTEDDVPTEQQGAFRDLADLFFVADTRFQALSDMREETLTQLSTEGQEDPGGLLNRPVTADALLAYLHSSELYQGRERADLEAVQSLAEQLRQAGYRRLADVDEAVRTGAPAFSQDDGARSSKFADVGRVRMSVLAIDSAFDAIVDGSWLGQ
jgi:putative GTP pyrophosphokinase